jgi:hypothetical protein
MNCDHIKRLMTLTSENIKRLSLYLWDVTPANSEGNFDINKLLGKE